MSGAEVLLLALVGLVLTGLPAIAAAMLAVSLGVRSVPLILCLALAASGAAAMLSFWSYFLPAAIAPTGSYLVLFGSIGVVAWSLPGAIGRPDLLRRLAVPLALWALATLFVVFFGFLYGGADGALDTGSLRFATDPTPFATDSSIPHFYAEWLFTGPSDSPPVFPGEWQFSDRPPLQIGYVLSNRVFETDMGQLRYVLIGVALQQLWIVAMWALLSAARVSARTRGLAIVAALLSDVAIVSGFYVWPKLMGGAFVLAALALLVAPGEPEVRRRPWAWVPLGALCALAFLSHGTGAFGLVAIGAVLLWRCRRNLGSWRWRWLAAGAATFLVLVVPWMAYQHYGDPPGNRLFKWSLAGAPAVDGRGSLETVIDEYGAAGVGGTIENKLQNFLTMAGGNPASGDPPPDVFQFGDVITESGDALTAAADGDLGAAVSKLREMRYWHMFWLAGLLPIGLLAIAFGRLRGRRREGADWWLARFCLFVFAVGTIGWGLLMFGNIAGRALAMSCSFALPLIGIVGIVAGLRATYPRLAAWLVAVNAVATLALFTPFLSSWPGYSFSLWAALLAAVSLAAIVVLVMRDNAGSIEIEDVSAELRAVDRRI